MKRIILFLLLVLISCSSENAFTCIQTEGESITHTFEVTPFNALVVESRISVVIKQASVQKITVTTGSNLLDNIKVEVKNNTLYLSENSSCNWLRDYEVTTFYIETPTLTTIRNASTGSIKSDGILAFESLDLISNTDAGVNEPNKSGDFTLSLTCNRFTIAANGQSVFYISGTANRATFSFTDEVPKLEASNFLVNKLTILQRSATFMRVHPLEQLTGEIRGTGDVISVNRPPVVEVTQYYTGQLIFEE